MIERRTLARVLPFATYIFFIVLFDLLKTVGVSAATVRWLYPVQIGMVVFVLALFWREYDELRGTAHTLSVRHWALAVLVGLLVFVLWINCSAAWMVRGSTEAVDPRGNGPVLDAVFIAVRWAGAALIVPVMEELFWRSFLMRWIEKPEFLEVNPANTGWKAFLITAALFAIEHTLWFAGLLAGFAYNLLYQKSRNLWSPIAAHAVTNGVLGGWVLATGNWSYW
jgi:uncharacterized protein